MTQHHKCVTCRRRKVKCDEQRPRCGQCKTKDRDCQYPSSKIRRLHVTLVDRSLCERDDPHSMPILSQDSALLKPANSSGPEVATSLVPHETYRALNKDGHGVMKLHNSHYTIPIAPKLRGSNKLVPFSVGRFPSSPEDNLRARFIELVDAKPVQWNPSFLWGKWLLLIAARLGTNQALDDATLCFVSGTVVHQSKTYDNIVISQKAYGRALSSLQRALVVQNKASTFSTETIAATKLLTAFEILMDLKSDRWKKHYHGLGNMLASRGHEADQDEMFRSLYYSLLPHEFNEAISMGKDSVFDVPGWLHFPPPEYATEHAMFRIIYQAMMQIMVRLARLIRLVRRVRAVPADAGAAFEASALATKLYQTNLNHVISSLSEDFPRYMTTTDENLKKYYPQSFCFNTICVFEALMRYSICRILLIGLCRQLVSFGLFNPQKGTSTLADQELECAGMVAMSVQYAEQLDKPIPMGALLTIVPLQVAAGAWHRSVRASSGCEEAKGKIGNNAEDEKSKYLMNWCLRKSNEMLQAWNGEQMSEQMLKAQVDVLEGGVLEGWNGRMVFPM